MKAARLIVDGTKVVRTRGFSLQLPLGVLAKPQVSQKQRSPALQNFTRGKSALIDTTVPNL
ncbi:MAG: hypothetical protein DMF60_07260 [Acidobacteria bacterium]|nr:MAG: hypothetical protein DMF60_07260 [Acidobacteriota bacterium]